MASGTYVVGRVTARHVDAFRTRNDGECIQLLTARIDSDGIPQPLSDDEIVNMSMVEFNQLRDVIISQSVMK